MHSIQLSLFYLRLTFFTVKEKLWKHDSLLRWYYLLNLLIYPVAFFPHLNIPRTVQVQAKAVNVLIKHNQWYQSENQWKTYQPINDLLFSFQCYVENYNENLRQQVFNDIKLCLQLGQSSPRTQDTKALHFMQRR